MNEIMTQLLNELKTLNKNLSTNANENKKYLTVADVAKRMDCSINNVRQWIEAGHLKAFQYKGTIRISAVNLDQFVKTYTA